MKIVDEVETGIFWTPSDTGFPVSAVMRYRHYDSSEDSKSFSNK